MSVLTDLSRAVECGKKKQAELLTQQALDEGYTPDIILSEALVAAMDTVGTKFDMNQVFVPEMLVSARAMNACLDVLQPHIQLDERKATRRAAVCTVAGDVHDLGKRLVKINLETRGFEVDDLGADCASSVIVDYCRSQSTVVVLCISALLTTTMPRMQEVVEMLEEAGVRNRVKIFVGGGPVTQSFADSIGADYYTVDAMECARVAAECMQDN